MVRIVLYYFKVCMFRRELNLVICSEESVLSRNPIAIEIKAVFGAFFVC